MNGKGQILTVIGVGVALGGLMLRGHADINRGIRSLQEDVASLREDTHRDIAHLRERMARLEGLFEGHLNREDCP